MQEVNPHEKAYKILKIIAMGFLCVAFIVGITVGLVLIKQRDHHTKNALVERNLCLSKPCSRQGCLIIISRSNFEKSDRNYITATRILRNMDKLVNPCSDFYNFTCGNFMRHSKIQKDKSRLLVVLENTKIIEEELLASYSADLRYFIEPIRKIQSFYHQCSKSLHHKFDSVKKLKQILLTLKWPFLYEHWNEEYSKTFNWLDVEATFSKLGLSPAFLSTEVKYDMKNYSAAYVSLDCTVPSLSHEILNVSKIVTECKSIIREFIEIITEQPSENGANEVLQFFLEIEKIKPTRFEISEGNLFNAFKTVKAGILEEELTIDVVTFLNDVLPSSIRVTKDTLIATHTYNCLWNITSMLKAADKKTTANYMMWAGVQGLLWIINNDTRKLDFRMNRILTGVQAPLPLYRRCLEFIDEQLPELSSALYVKLNTSPHKKRTLTTMVTLLIDELMEAVQEATWMDKSTKQMAKEKVNKLLYIINYYDAVVQDRYLYSTYRNLNVTSDLIKNVMHIRRISYLHNLETLLWSAEKRNKASLLPLAHVVNAYYQPGLNAIAIPAGITHGYIYSDEQEAYLNFGAIGIIIGHELSHIFDSIGRLYDARGNFVNWWSRESNLRFLKKSECFIKQYDNFTYGHNLKMNGTLTLGENMADAGGILLAYRAFLKWKEKHEMKKLRGLENYTLEQLFWISVGNTWCDKIRPERLPTFFKTDVHSIGNFRIIGSLSNLPEFSKDFNCPSESPMNRKGKCLIW